MLCLVSGFFLFLSDQANVYPLRLKESPTIIKMSELKKAAWSAYWSGQPAAEGAGASLSMFIGCGGNHASLFVSPAPSPSVPASHQHAGHKVLTGRDVASLETKLYVCFDGSPGLIVLFC